MPLYIVMKHPAGDLAALGRVADECLPRLDLARFFVHFNHNNLSLAPRHLGKEHAVRFLRDRLGTDILTIGVADSLSDVPYLSLCDAMMTPRATQLAGAILRSQNVAARDERPDA